MWERQYKRGRWNGHTLNIVSTSIDGGKRLHVSEIPYADLPHIKVMGSKSRTINLEVVFVGTSSLAEANAFIESLDASPVGELEHPWLGELSLTFETVSQSINTKRGLVSLSLAFVRSGVSPTITTSTDVRVREQSAIVDSLSSASFSESITNMTVSEINQTQDNIIDTLNVLVDITNRLNLADDTLQDINNAINQAFSFVSSLSGAPSNVAVLLTTAINAVADGVQAEPTSVSEAVDNSRCASALMLGLVKDNAPTTHHNVQVVTGAIKMSKDVTELEASDSFDVTQGSKQTTIMQSDVVTLIENIDDRVTQVTHVSTLESIELYDALVVLKNSVQAQYDKVVAGCISHRVVQAPRAKPALVVAHDERTDEKVITAINALQHPLFMRGELSVRDV
ncbi:DNA circularization N-terminal domain-containing protein [Vibrio sp. DW001]|uniref:DNA circularization N-terminal domain-containing protein n=1 Tax=Vibrio sp. DW001 TaxID=2912315 RepID=UPI0023B0B20E|nr:DNA circularization N-terminal domain-containing protein [Vibrio sp. DW001]WED29888.1 DNA circularization N-terminal domain-containing protein [Vibrio sp. DW001]